MLFSPALIINNLVIFRVGNMHHLANKRVIPAILYLTYIIVIRYLYFSRIQSGKGYRNFYTFQYLLE